MLSFHDVVVAFGALRAVGGVSFTVPAGERRAVIGPNGAGKTTLFDAATGVIRATAGRIVFGGRDITRLQAHRRAALGMSRTFQINNLFPTLTVGDNVALAVRAIGRRKFALLGSPRLEVAEAARIASVLTVVGLGGHAARLVAELSYGEQRQLELALALAGEPRLLMLDEPAAGLSPAERGMLAAIIRALPRDLTLVLIEHDMDLVLGVADRVTCMHEGRVLAEGTPDAIRTDPRVREVYLGRPRHA